MSNKNICIHIFRRDYRLEDNTTLIEACKTHELKDVKSSHLHKWYDYHIDYNLTDIMNTDKNNKITINYIKPIVDYTIEKEKNLKMYKKYLY